MGCRMIGIFLVSLEPLLLFCIKLFSDLTRNVVVSLELEAFFDKVDKPLQVVCPKFVMYFPMRVLPAVPIFVLTW